MKIYTEEQLQEAYSKGHMDGRLNNIDYSITDGFKPIELPSEEEIAYEVITWNVYNMTPLEAFRHGVNWTKEQILNQNK